MAWITITIREARVDEWDKIPLLHRDEGEEYVKSSMDRNKARFEKVRLGRRIVLFAEYQGQIIGSVQLQLFANNPAIANGETIAHFDDLVVDPDFRAQGIGTQLLQKGEEVLRQKGFTEVTLAIRKGPMCVDLRHYYEKRGYSFAFEKENGVGFIFTKTI